MIQAGIDASGLRALAKDLRRASLDGSRLLSAGLKRAGEIVASDARSRASAWSTRIPGSIRVRTSQRGVTVHAGGDPAPHAATFEPKANGQGQRHPVFGGPRWVTQKPRPFMVVALEAHLPEVEEAAAQAIDAITAEAGFH